LPELVGARRRRFEGVEGWEEWQEVEKGEGFG